MDFRLKKLFEEKGLSEFEKNHFKKDQKITLILSQILYRLNKV